MKSRIWLMRAIVFCALGAVGPASAGTYYINDTNGVGDVYTSATGNDANSGTATNAPKATLTNLFATTTLLPNDIVYIDTGSYAPVTIPSSVTGAPGSAIVFQGSTNYAAGGSTFGGAGAILTVSGRYLSFYDLRAVGGAQGVKLTGTAAYCELERIWCVTNLNVGVWLNSAKSNAFRRCVLSSLIFSSIYSDGTAAANYFEDSILLSSAAGGLQVSGAAVSNITGCIMVGRQGIFQNGNEQGTRNIFYPSGAFHPAHETLAEFQRNNPNWSGNTVADPKFFNADALDFHLLSAAGFVSNGVWVTNAAVGYSPAIDFGRADDPAYASEPDPNGGRRNTGLYGGTAQASKSRSGPWLFAMAFNDGGNLIQTGRLEWVASTNLAAATVDLQFSTNNGVSWSNIATGVAATNESYVWVPTVAHPAVLWRVISSSPAAGSTNARLFSVRPATNTVLSFFVNDGATAGDVYCSAAGTNANLGVHSNAPKGTLQGILDVYSLRGGDVVYVDTGTYLGATPALGAYDSGSAGNPVRILGSPGGSVFDRGGSPSADGLDLSGASNVEIENLRLANGRYGLNGGSANITLRNLRFTGNQNGVYVTGQSHMFVNCVAADNTTRAFWGSGAGTNQWLNGVLWGSPTLIFASTNTLSVSNSILGNGTALFGSQVVPGDHNVVWNTGVGLSYATFSALQSSGWGWERSLYADPLFANTTNGDFHLKSVMGRYDTNTAVFVTNDLVHSPAIDFGNPATAVGSEPAPNGSRVNAGMHGATAQASKSRTNAWLQALSFMDGGTLDARAGAWLRWTGTNYSSGATVTIWLSRDDGDSWEVLTNGISAASGALWYQNTSTNDPSSIFARWKVELDEDPAVSSGSPTNFSYRNGSYAFYVNDGSTAGDIYCTVAGSDANLGVSAGSPMANLHALIDRYQLGPGDRVYVDTGAYTSTNTAVLTAQDSGVATNPVVIVGSTNRVGGGSEFGRRAGAIPLGFAFHSGASNIVLQNLILTNMARGVAMTNAVGIVLENVEMRGATSRAFDLQGNSRSNQLLRCVAHGGAVGLYMSQATNITVRHGVFWENSTHAVQVGSGVGVQMEHNVFGSSRTNAILFSLTSTNGFFSDYNGIHVGPLARVGTRGSAVVDDLAAWQGLSGGQDVHGVPGNPQMADPEQFDYHLKTEQTLGRRRPDGTLTSDPVSSPLLDAGNPGADFSQEPAPNGNRVNIGKFGGTWEASSAPVTPWIRTVSFGDQGSVTNGGSFLVWTASGVYSNETATVEVSVDGGKTWASPPVATNVPLTNGFAPWTVAGLPDTPAGAWRVVCEQSTNQWARSTNFFAIRNTNLDLYVATVDTNEAIYATGPGLPDNWQASAAAPLDSLRTLFERLDLEPGDRIWVDNGTYTEDAVILVGMKDSGTSNQPIRVTGNPAAPYEQVVLRRGSRTVGAYVIQLAYANGIEFRSLMVSNAYIGVRAENCQALALDRVRVSYCVTNGVLAGANARMDLTACMVDQSLGAGLQTSTGTVVRVRNSLIQDCSGAIFNLQGGSVEVENSVLMASGNQRYVYYYDKPTALASDYNNIRASDGASVAGGAERLADRFLIDWQISSGFSNDVSSFGYDPQFADEEAGDFHLKSEYGRFNPALGVFQTNDDVTSRLIDLGDPAYDFANEPADNGGRINVGLYGNTAEASKSPPPGTGVLVPLTMSDGGTVRGTVQLYWTWNGVAGSNYVHVQFSGDGGSTWTNIGTDYVNAGSMSWNTTNFASTAQGVWRVVLESDPSVYGQTETLFAVKNDPLAYFINDGSTDGDVYCSAIGRATNTGLSSNAPLNSMETLFNRYKIEHGDTIYVDTGVYPRGTPLVISVPATAPTNYLVIQGSTNELAGGSVFTNSGSGAVIDIQGSRNVDLRDLRLHGGGQGLLLTQSSSNLVTRVRAVGTRGNGFTLGLTSDQNRFSQCAALGFFQTGIHVEAVSGLIPPATNHWINGVVASVAATSNGTAVATGALVGVQSGRLNLSNSVFVANGPGHIVFSTVPGAVRGDYNAFHRPYASSLFAVSRFSVVFGVGETLLNSFGQWTEWNQSDSNSFAADPMFADLVGGDLHPRSAGGRYDPVAAAFTNDEVTSPLIDTADPAADWAMESGPNGGRANLGVHGGTPQASRSPADGTFVLLSFSQGGLAQGTNVWLRWQARGGVTNHAVYIYLSTNSGTNWQTIGTNMAATGVHVWNSTTNASVPTARWRIQSQSQPSWIAASEQDFAIHNSNIVFYVNDAATTGDVYCVAAGSTNNSGLSADSPLSSLAAVLARYDLEPGDSVLIDTGNYSQNSAIRIGYLDSGTAANPIVIQGITNRQGTVFSGAGFQIESARGVSIRNIKFVNHGQSVAAAQIKSSEDIAFEHLDILGGNNGVDITTSSNVYLRHFSAAATLTNGVSSLASFNTRLEFGTIWSNRQVQVRIQNLLGGATAYAASYVTVSNCVLGAYGSRQPIYELRGTLYADYNNLYLGPGALVALSYPAGFVREIDSVGSWATSEYAQDAHSLSLDPRFANVREGDFHLKSSAGRFDPATGTFVPDPAADNSPLIDAADPARAFGNEPDPNGARANIGRYGNTPEASKTPTNGALTLVSFNDGGRASGTNVLVTWNARGAATNGTVAIFYSADGGLTWTNLATNVSATAGSWIWNTTLSEQTAQGKLKIELEPVGGPTPLYAVSAGLFAVRNQPFHFFINDNSTVNDVYCSAPGSDTNSGLSAATPMASLGALLTKYDLESSTNGADVVFIDTGRYLGQEWRIAQSDSAGTLDLPPVVFQGSTNSLVNGTVLDRTFNATGIRADYAVGIQLRNIIVSNSSENAVVLNDCYGVDLEWITVGRGKLGFRLNGGNRLRVANCLLLRSEQGATITGTTSAETVLPVIEHCVFWNPSNYAVQISGSYGATVRHNIFAAVPNQYVYGLDTYSSLEADFNAIWLQSGARVYRRVANPVPIIYETVGSWAAATSNDLHTYSGDPLVADPENWNFQLKSRAGRWTSGTNWVLDEVTSPLIDAGDPDSTAWTNEPAPNGGRVNVGLFGGTPWASKSETNSALHLLSLNQGGVASGQVALNWKATGLATGHTVRLEVSIDDGATWTLVAAGVPAVLGGVTWNSLSLPSSPLALWRVLDEEEPGVEAASEQNFVLHNGSVAYYVNDGSTVGDIYCAAAGHSTNTGASADSPKRWISEIVDAYNLEPGDVIYLDTGYYQTDSTTVFGELDAGGLAQSASQQVTIQGSTNTLAGGSQYFILNPERSAFHLDETYGIRFSHLEIVNATNGLAIDDSFYVGGEWLRIRGCGNGVTALSSSNIVFSRTTLAGNYNAGIYFSGRVKESLRLGASVLWSNRYGIYLDQGYATISNSVFGMVAPDSYGVYRLDKSDTDVQSDYNSLYVQQPTAFAGAVQVGEGGMARTSTYATVSAWSLATGQDTHSLAHDPRLADPGAGDFHLKSSGGRWLPGIGWTYDGVSSPLIDSGHPAAMGWTAEPDPNGRRLNIGLYGGTAEASRTPVDGWLTLITLVDGGNASGNVDLKWKVGGAATNYTVCIEYSPDNGLTWTNIVCGWPASLESYTWDSLSYGRSAQALWRAYCVENPFIYSASIGPFMLRNLGTIPFYVNDSSTNGDVYCQAVGDDSNNGLTPDKPKASLQAILDAYELAPEDVVYVDAGTYVAGSPPVTIDQKDSGWSNLFVTIQGSTNPVKATTFVGSSFSAPSVISLQYAVNVRLRNLVISNASVGVESYQTIGCELDNVRIANNQSAGLYLNQSQNFKMIRSLLWKNAGEDDSVAVVLGNSTLAIENSVLWGSPTAIVLSLGSLTVTNSVLDASGPGGRIYMFDNTASAESGFHGDYNNYSRKNGALIAEQQIPLGGSELYNDLLGWSQVNSSDRHSMTINPAFANEVTGDFHPKSPQGRYSDGAWFVDTQLSPLVDAGSPAMSPTNEPAPNGGYVNIGAFGNTPQASMTQTNPPWLRAISCNEPGTLSGSTLLYWLHGGMSNETPVRLEYSTDYQVDWHPIASNVPAGNREYLWDVSSLPLTLVLNWRVVHQNETNVWDVSDQPVSVKTTNYVYYVNDSSTSGDVWCAGPGLAWDPLESYGTNAATPLNSLKALLDHYPVAGGDVIYIDTGTYPVSSGNPVVFNDRNMGTAAYPLVIHGSTNVLAGGTLLQGNATSDGIRIQNTRHIHLNNLRIAGTHNGISIQNADTVILNGIESFNNRTNGIAIAGSAGVETRNARLWKNGRYGFQTEAGGKLILQSTIWGNAAGAVSDSQGGLAISNSILVVTNATPVFRESSGWIVGDYNMFGLAPGAAIGVNQLNLITYANLRQWQEAGRDVHSVVLDPLFVNPAAGDFHLQSRAGYWSNGTWAVSTNTSWAIDAGNPLAAYANEPATNGFRVNLGAYGNTPQASKSDSSVPELLPITLRDGGIAPNGQELYWLYRGLSATNPVRIDYSPDMGVTWFVVNATLTAGSAPMVWYDTESEASPEALWRIVWLGGTNVWGVTPTNFTFRPKPLVYYVNDGSLVGDVYTSAPGSPTNRGYMASSPLDSIQAVLAKFQLTPADGIKVDTGVYAMSTSAFVSVLNSGSAAEHVYIKGSTNTQAGGTWLQDASGGRYDAFNLYGVRYVDLSHFRMSGFASGVSVNEMTLYCSLADLDIQGSTNAGVTMSRALGIGLERVLIREGAQNGVAASLCQFAMDSCVLWSNRSSAIQLGNGATMELTNSVIEASGQGQYCYLALSNNSIRADYNNLYAHDGAQIALFSGVQYEQIPQWSRMFVQDRYSLSVDPLFHDPANGDFHLQSLYGRYDPIEGHYVTNDAQHSPLIDMGPPRAAWSNEPAPNGERRNIGLYGNTAQASKSRTDRWFQTITGSSGGILKGVIFLTWGYDRVNIGSNEQVQLEYSADDGESWNVIIGEYPAGAGYYVWDSDGPLGTVKWPSSPDGIWRIFLQNEPEILDATDEYFGLRPPFTFYLNDASLLNDLYCVAVGSDTNRGTMADRPKASLVALLQARDLEPGDMIKVDTGVYQMSDTNAPILWEVSDGGEAGAPIRVQGSTHPDRSVFIATNPFVAGGFFFMNANYVDIRDVHFAGESMRFVGSGLVVSNLTLTNRPGYSIALGITSDNSVFDNVQLDRGSFSLSGQGNRVDRLRQRWGGLSIVGTNVTLLHSAVLVSNANAIAVEVNAAGSVISNCTIVSSRGTALSKFGSGILRLNQNILVAGGSDSNSVIAWNDGAVISDWNSLRARDAAWVGVRNGKWEKLAYWQAASGQDANSVSFEPLFAWEETGDLHLKSVQGRWNSNLGLWETDAEHSPLIDLANPWVGSGLEPMPNGYRMNLGAYGGTTNASLSRTNFWLTALSLNDGGVAKGTNVVLRWAVSNNASSTVRLDYFDGTSWTNIAAGLAADAGLYVWNTTNFTDSFNAYWRVVAEDGSWADTNDTAFALRNYPWEFYVNDSDPTDDIYCSEPGSDANDGLAPDTPKATLQALLDAYDLEGGDTVYLDTGTYSSTSNVRVVWSRGGDDAGDVVIQGNTNGPFTVLTRSGYTNYPAVGIEAKASQLQLRDLAIRGVDRGIWLESNRNVTVQGALLRETAVGVSAEEAEGTTVRNSAFWRTGFGVSLDGTLDTRLENLTFALPTLAGIRLEGSEIDVLQNNIFIPDVGAQAYYIGTATSLLTRAAMDYNLYDFGRASSGFFLEYTNDLRRWQLAMSNDFRSAVTDHGLAEIEWTGDFHPLSTNGRWVATATGGDWTMDDASTSWAVDHGDPDSDFSLEPADNGGRINIGMYGNTAQASRGDTNVFFEIRSLDEPGLRISQNDQVWPMIWSAHLVDGDELVLVQFSGDGGLTWDTLTTLDAYAEYYVWQASIDFSTGQGRWRVIGVNNSNLVAQSENDFVVQYRDLGILTRPYAVAGLMRFEWEGGIQGRRYEIRYSDDFGKTWYLWEEKYNGPATINKSNFVIPSGGSQLTYTFEDRTSYLKRTRWYRIYQFDE